MQAITTKYLCATNFRGARIKASCERGSITVSYPDELSGDTVHIYAADKLIEKFVKEDAQRYGTERNPWTRPRTCGQFASGEYAHVFGSMDGNTVLVEFASPNDAEHFKKYASMARTKDGTVSGLWAGIMCSALKRAKL